MTTELAVFNEVTAIISKAKAENDKLVFAYDTPDGEKAARSHISNLRKVKTKIGDVHKDAKAEALALGRKLDGKKRELIGEVDGMIAVHKDPLDVIEAEKQAVIDAERVKLEEAEAKRQAGLEAREAAVREAEEKVAKDKADAERIEREKRIAEEAAGDAKAKAEYEYFQAQEKAKADADAKELAQIKAKERAEATEQKRIANKKHRKQIEDEIHFGLTEIGFASADSNTILFALKENRIPHITINY